MPARTLLQVRYWGVHVLALVLLAIAVWLGLWQLDSWKAQREAEARDLTNADPVSLTDVLGPDDPFPGDQVGRPVETSGTWVPDGTVYVANRLDGGDGDSGYWVVTPLAVPGADDPAVLVVRGWVADLDDAPPPPKGQGELTGWLQPGEGTGEIDEDPNDDVIPQLRLGDALQHVDQDLYGGYIVLDPDAAHTNTANDGLRPASLDALPESGRFTALRNMLYAIQWWVFGAFVIVVWFRHCQDLLAARAAEENGGDGPPEGGDDDPGTDPTPTIDDDGPGSDERAGDRTPDATPDHDHDHGPDSSLDRTDSPDRQPHPDRRSASADDVPSVP